MHVWANPPNTSIPITRPPVRVAVGTPEGRSSNSWRIWVKGLDAYVVCRDNFREVKVSLHASGIWRVALTEETIKSRPEFALPGGDRVLHRRSPDLNGSNMAVIGFQIIILKAGLYLGKKDRLNWPTSIIFIEPPGADTEMTVLSATVVLSKDPLALSADTRGVLIAVLPLGADRTVQLVASHQVDANTKSLVEDAIKRNMQLAPVGSPEGLVFTAHGYRPDGIPWISAVPYNGFVGG